MNQRAFIREQDCIGCARCLPLCPTDAIVGALQFLHVVIEEDCIGCERCLPVCPVDCIELLPMSQEFVAETMTHEERVQRKQYIQFLARRHQTREEKKKARARAFFIRMRDQGKDDEPSSAD